MNFQVVAQVYFFHKNFNYCFLFRQKKMETLRPRALQAWSTHGYNEEECVAKWNHALEKIVQSAESECTKTTGVLKRLRIQIDAIADDLNRPVPKILREVESCTLVEQVKISQNILNDFASEKHELQGEIGRKRVLLLKLREALEIDVEDDDEDCCEREMTRDRLNEMKDEVTSLRNEIKERDDKLDSLVNEINSKVRQVNQLRSESIPSSGTSNNNNKSKSKKEEGIKKRTTEIRPNPQEEVLVTNDSSSQDIHMIGRQSEKEVVRKSVTLSVATFVDLNMKRYRLESIIRKISQAGPKSKIEHCRSVYRKRVLDQTRVHTTEFKETFRKMSGSAKRQDQQMYQQMLRVKNACQPKEILRLLEKWKERIEDWEKKYGDTFVYMQQQEEEETEEREREEEKEKEKKKMEEEEEEEEEETKHAQKKQREKEEKDRKVRDSLRDAFGGSGSGSGSGRGRGRGRDRDRGSDNESDRGSSSTIAREGSMSRGISAVCQYSRHELGVLIQQEKKGMITTTTRMSPSRKKKKNGVSVTTPKKSLTPGGFGSRVPRNYSSKPSTAGSPVDGGRERRGASHWRKNTLERAAASPLRPPSHSV